MNNGSNVAERLAKYAGGLTNTALHVAMSSGKAWLDMMMNFQSQMQRASLQSFSVYSPTADTRITGRTPKQSDGMEVISLGEERLNMATCAVQGETTRLRQRIIAQSVEQQVTLRDEKVIVEHRPPTGTNLEPNVLTFGDGHDVLSQTKQGLDEVVRERAYCLWQQEGCPEGRADEYWHRAHDQHLRERAYCLWQQEGCPEGRADEYWHRTREFETH
jgi:Protein of unknown function (DUF2934)/Domain of unknown function (DUF2382)